MNHHSRPEFISPRLIGCAALCAPPDLTERLREEWLADLCDRTGPLSRLGFALGCLWAAITIAHDGATAPVVSVAPSADVPVAGAILGASGGHGGRLYSLDEGAADAPAICDINTTPLIDVLLVLLITLILSLPLLNHAVRIELPQGTAVRQVPPETIDVEIYFDGTLLWNGRPVSGLRQLGGYFQAEAQKATQPEIHLRPSGHVKYDVVAKVLALAQRNGIRKVGFSNTGEFAR